MGSRVSRRRAWRVGASVAATAAAFGLLAVTGVAGTSAGGGDPAPATFRLADGSAGCAYLASGELACRTADSRRALVLDAEGDVRPDEAEVGWTDSTPVLLPAESWWHGDYSCRVVRAALRCTSVAGGVLEVGRARAAVAGAPVTITVAD